MPRELVQCEVPGCTKRHTRGKLMCRDHWFSLPKRIRDQHMRTFSEYRDAIRFRSQEPERARMAASALSQSSKALVAQAAQSG